MFPLLISILKKRLRKKTSKGIIVIDNTKENKAFSNLVIL